MSRSLEDARRWAALGTRLFSQEVAGLSEEDFDGPTLLPAWNRRQLVAHVAANADAIGNLVHWAATGEETPMYSSPEERAAGIDTGLSMTGDELREWLESSAVKLERAMDALTDDQWAAEVRTAQGRTVPASETPWMRSREVCVHAVDLHRGTTFADLPDDFLTALGEDIRTKRGDVPEVEGPLPEVTAWLAGRPHQLTDAPELGPWL